MKLSRARAPGAASGVLPGKKGKEVLDCLGACFGCPDSNRTHVVGRGTLPLQGPWMGVYGGDAHGDAPTATAQVMWPGIGNNN